MARTPLVRRTDYEQYASSSLVLASIALLGKLHLRRAGLMSLSTVDKAVGRAALFSNQNYDLAADRFEEYGPPECKTPGAFASILEPWRPARATSALSPVIGGAPAGVAGQELR
jgi:hypothetical protein